MTKIHSKFTWKKELLKSDPNSLGIMFKSTYIYSSCPIGFLLRYCKFELV